MALKQTKNIWFNDKLVPWEDATIHVLTYALHYGAAVFEGIRAYKTDDGCKIFRLDEHIKRLLNSAKIYRMNVPYSHQELKNACQIIVSSNDLNEGAYIRPIAFRGYDDLGLHAHNNDAIDVVVAAWEWGPYLGNASLNDGVDACVSSWNKINPNTVPFMAKASGNYLSGTLVAMEARQNGYDEGILLDSKGMVSEGAGENIFMVKDGNLYTPPLSSSVLDGITRDAVIKIAGSLKLGVIETEIPREQLYIADELFFTGTAVEITPIKSVDKITIGTGTKGPVTAQIQKVFFGLFDGSTEDSWGWLEPVE
ncbi:MAG TPA: branched-chain amino acid transaminase [Gammaproteobacteria bacterium]|jgi:branched-chain amino acid aminotransferase|nr:branched-chain amino acid transaminase [Gammaproteobacteria bacterium]HIG35132.1 branched-chain amino acid transaminase [Gammaproteobacteria bacterium]